MVMKKKTKACQIIFWQEYKTSTTATTLEFMIARGFVSSLLISTLMLSQYPGHKCHSHWPWRLDQVEPSNYKNTYTKTYNSLHNERWLGRKKTFKIYNTSRSPTTGIKILRIVIFLTEFSDMSNLFDVANKNVRGKRWEKKNEELGYC